MGRHPPGSRHGPRVLGGLVVTVLFALLTPLSACAHALLVSSNPQPGQTLGTGPGVVVLEFSEPLNPRLSSASVADPTGHEWRGEVTSGQEMRVPVETNSQGTYTVAWTSVSLTDGHKTTGSLTFGVGVSAAASKGSVGIAANPQPTDVLI